MGGFRRSGAMVGGYAGMYGNFCLSEAIWVVLEVVGCRLVVMLDYRAILASVSAV